MTTLMISVGVLLVLAAMGYLAACAGAERWLPLREWLGPTKGRRVDQAPLTGLGETEGGVSMALSKWIPESEPAILRRIGKTGEEAAELGKVCSRITIQGLAGRDPVSGVPNIRSLIDELADVQAQIYCCIQQFDLDREYMARRTAEKIRQMREWEAMFQTPVWRADIHAERTSADRG